MNDEELYVRGAETLLASWEAIARGSRGARVIRGDRFAAAVFPHGPERSIYNNALLEPGASLDALEEAYAGIDGYALWVREGDQTTQSALAARGYAITETTRAMGMELGDARGALPELDLAPPVWADYVRYLERFGVPSGLLAGVDPSAFRLLLARHDGEVAATALGFDRDGDRGIFNVSTVEHARRRGLGTALTAWLVHEAAARGSRTASLQSTEMAERVYAAVGFRDLGRFLEYGR
jgi:GNAT superfamily N-acetyltransferase